MKIIKKILAIVLSALLIITLTACTGGSGENSTKEPDAPKYINAYEDTDAMNLHFAPPEGYDTVERSVGKTGTDSIKEKSFTYTFADKSSVIIGYTVGESITESVPQRYLDEAKTATYAGKEFQVIEEGNTKMALCQEGDVIYAIGYSFANGIDNDKFEALMAGISFTDATTTQENDDDLFGIKYDANGAGNICSTNVIVTEKSDGTLVNKSINWHYGTDEKSLDYRFIIRVYKNTTVEEQLNADYTYEQKDINGITYSVRKAEEGKTPFEYFTQHGTDVYKIYNNGVSSGWTTTRSEQSESAFETFLNSISFE